MLGLGLSLDFNWISSIIGTVALWILWWSLSIVIFIDFWIMIFELVILLHFFVIDILMLLAKWLDLDVDGAVILWINPVS